MELLVDGIHSNRASKWVTQSGLIVFTAYNHTTTKVKPNQLRVTLWDHMIMPLKENLMTYHLGGNVEAIKSALDFLPLPSSKGN